MDSEYLQNLRYKLQKRVKKLNTTQFTIFHQLLKQFWNFLQSHPILAGILEDLEHRCPTMEDKAREVIESKAGDPQKLLPANELENAALSYFVIKKCVESDNDIEFEIGLAYSSDVVESLEQFKRVFLETLYEYLDEHIDDQRIILALLRRYKHKCEWFQRDNLIKLSEQGERKLAEHLYEYLYDQGLNFVIEPRSASGEADLVSIQKGDEPLIADVKVFDNNGRGKSYICKGFNQIYTYTRDYNEPFGYLVIYKTCEEEPKFLLANQTQSTPFVIHNNKTIFLITIDIFPYEATASKRGTLKTIDITEEDLIKAVEESVK